jgi:hypothetical protein
MSERAVCIFGPPGCGVTTVCQVLANASRQRVVIVTPGDIHIEDAVERAYRDGADHVLVDGVPKSAAAVQDIVDSRLVFPGNGAVIRISTSRPHGNVTEGGWRLFFNELTEVERRIRLLSAPYFVVQNEPGEEGLGAAIAEVARRAGITE